MNGEYITDRETQRQHDLGKPKAKSRPGLSSGILRLFQKPGGYQAAYANTHSGFIN